MLSNCSPILEPRHNADWLLSVQRAKFKIEKRTRWERSVQVHRLSHTNLQQVCPLGGTTVPKVVSLCWTKGRLLFVLSPWAWPFLSCWRWQKPKVQPRRRSSRTNAIIVDMSKVASLERWRSLCVFSHTIEWRFVHIVVTLITLLLEISGRLCSMPWDDWHGDEGSICREDRCKKCPRQAAHESQGQLSFLFMKSSQFKIETINRQSGRFNAKSSVSCGQTYFTLPIIGAVIMDFFCSVFCVADGNGDTDTSIPPSQIRRSVHELLRG